MTREACSEMACGRVPGSGADLASRPTISRLENTPDLRALIRMSHGLVKMWCRSHASASKSITLDIDDTADTVHGHQQLSLFNAHYDERYLLPIHVYDAERGRNLTGANRVHLNRMTCSTIQTLRPRRHAAALHVFDRAMAK
jgi:hypothetical protein